MSNRFNNDFEGGQTAEGNGIQFFTGLGAIKLLTVNPTIDELNAILGRTAPDNGTDPLAVMCDYSLKKNPNTEEMERPVMFWVENQQGSKFSVSINVGNVPRKFSTGKVRIINNAFQDSIAVDITPIQENPRMSWFKIDGSTRPALIGEYELYWFMSKLIRFDTRNEKADWQAQMIKTQCDIDSIYNGNYDGLKEFVEYANQNENLINVLHIVKETTKDDGSIKLRQEILINPDTWFRTSDGSITQGMIDKLNKVREDALKREKDITTTRMYTFDFQAYNKLTCLNYEAEPADTATLTGDAGWVN